MIIFIGASGAGKGTQSELLIRENGYAYLATGDVLRKFATPDQRAQMLRGQWLSDKEMFALVGAALDAQPDPNRVIIDGFPRTPTQVKWLIDNATDGRYAIEVVVHLDVAPDVVRARLRARGREDDTLEAINARLSLYEANAKPMLELFRAQHCPVLDIDGNNASERVHRDIMDGLADYAESKTA